MKVALPLLLLFAACGGAEFEAASISSDPTGAHVDASGVPPTDADTHREATGPDSVRAGESEAASRDVLRDVLADPWPADVIVEPVCTWGGTPATGCPCVNCFLFDGPDGATQTYTCCDGSGNPPDAANDHLCNQGSYPSPHKAYCPSCSCQ